MAKFAPEFTEITVENLHGFCSSYIAGTLKVRSRGSKLRGRLSAGDGQADQWRAVSARGVSARGGGNVIRRGSDGTEGKHGRLGKN